MNLDFKIGAIILIIVAAWVGFDIANKVKTQPNTIIVSGSGEVFARPDLAVADFSVATEAKTAARALSDNTDKMNGVVNFMKEQGIGEKDLKTTNFSISPRYEYSKDGKRTFAGYEVGQSLQVKIRNLDTIGQIIEGAVAAGANQIGDLQFTIEKEDELKDQARGRAIDEAKTKAKKLASQLGVRLARIVNFSESGGGGPIFFAEKVAQAAQIETGENKVQVNVSITYEIR